MATYGPSYLQLTSTPLTHQSTHTRLMLYLLLLLPWMLAAARGVHVHEVVVPQPGVSGDAARLECNWSSGDKGFYSVRWYKDGEQFYSYVPRNKPQIQVDHNLRGVSVSLSMSDEKVVTLRKVDLASEGTYRCEVMSEAPTFQTSFAHANLTVVDLPDEPHVSGLLHKYTAGDTMRVNCTARNSRPPALIDFIVNGKLIHRGSGRILDYPTESIAGGRRSYPTHPNDLTTSKSQLVLPLSSRHVPAVSVVCQATVLTIKLETRVERPVERRSSSFSFMNAGVQTASCGVLVLLAAAVTHVLNAC